MSNASDPKTVTPDPSVAIDVHAGRSAGGIEQNLTYGADVIAAARLAEQKRLAPGAQELEAEQARAAAEHAQAAADVYGARPQEGTA